MHGAEGPVDEQGVLVPHGFRRHPRATAEGRRKVNGKRSLDPFPVKG